MSFVCSGNDCQCCAFKIYVKLYALKNKPSLRQQNATTFHSLFCFVPQFSCQGSLTFKYHLQVSFISVQMYYILRTEFSIIFSDKIPSFERKYGLCKMRVI